MSEIRFTIQPESSADLSAISALCARAFGPGRFARTAYRIRERACARSALGLIARAGERLAGAVRLTPVRIGGREGALLLGPLVVDPEMTGRGCGRMLIREGLGTARGAGYRLVLLVGDPPYYERSGFAPVPRGQIVFPGPVDPARILAAELEDGALGDFTGAVTGS